MEEKRASKCGSALPFFIGFLVSCVLGWVVLPPLFYEKVDQPIVFSHKIHVEGQDMSCDDCHAFREDGSYAGYPTNEKCAECHTVDEPADVIASIKEVVGADKPITDILKMKFDDMPEDLTGVIVSESDANKKYELEYVVKYLLMGKEVPWKTYQYQPDNVFFSHKAHAGLNIGELAKKIKAHELDLSGVVAADVFKDTDAETNCALCHPKGIGMSDVAPPVSQNILTGYSKTTMKMWQCEKCHAQNNVVNACHVCHK